MRTQRQRRSVSDFRYTPLVAALGAALAPHAAMAATITVTNPADDSVTPPVGSLREAILNVNANCSGADVINFSFPNGPFISAVSSPLPLITCGGLAIQGGGHESDVTSPTQLFGGAVFGDGLSAATLVPVTITGMELSSFTYGTALSGTIFALDNIVHDNDTGIRGEGGSVISGNRVFFNSTGISVPYGGETIQLNVVYSNSANGIYVENAPSGSITGNFVGIDDGSRPDLTAIGQISGNGLGLYLQNSTVSVQQNIISNNATGICLDGDLGSTVSTNKIGTDATGTLAAGNSIGIDSKAPSSSSVIIGNVISGNSDAGINLEFDTGISITGNLIGTDVTGTVPILNSAGIVALCGSGLSITNNVIGSSDGAGIEFDAVTGGGAGIVGNKIGVFGDGVSPLGSNSWGVILNGGNCALSLPGKVLRVKALAPASVADGIAITGNIIAHSVNDGVLLANAYNTNITGNTITQNGGYGVNITAGLGNQIVDNAIFANSAYTDPLPKNINLGHPGGPLPNDPGDVDVDPVPNDGQNYPVITSITRDPGGTTTIAYTLDSVPGVYRIDVMGNSAATTTPGGDQRLGVTSITVPSAGGPVSGTFTIPGATADFISMLATSPADPASGTGETSEFSAVANFIPTPGVAQSASSIDFGNVAINTDSPPRTVTLTSSGTAPYTIQNIGDSTCTGGSICYGGPFTCTTTCVPSDYAPGASCQITATFHPPTIGSFSRTIALCDNVPPLSRTISLTGSGVVPPPVAIFPAAFDFGATLLRTVGAPHDFTVFNPGTVAVSMGPPLTTEGFDVVGTTCGASLGASASCAVSVAFDPTNLGLISGSLSISASPGLLALSLKGARLAKVAAAPSATAALTGTGVIQAILDVPQTIDFGAYTSGTPAIRVLVPVRNDGNAVLSFNSITATGPFLLGNGCPLNLLPGDSCTLTLDYSASDLGIHTGSLVVVSNAVGGSRTISLTANTVATAAPLIRVSPLQIGFGDRLLGSASASQRVTISNVGNAIAVLSPPVLSNTDFLVTTTCGITLAPASTCFADVSLRPVGFGPRSGRLSINSNSFDSPAGVDLSGSGCRPFSSASSRLGANFGCLP